MSSTYKPHTSFLRLVEFDNTTLISKVKNTVVKIHCNKFNSGITSFLKLESLMFLYGKCRLLKIRYGKRQLFIICVYILEILYG